MPGTGGQDGIELPAGQSKRALQPKKSVFIDVEASEVIEHGPIQPDALGVGLLEARGEPPLPIASNAKVSHATTYNMAPSPSTASSPPLERTVTTGTVHSLYSQARVRRPHRGNTPAKKDLQISFPTSGRGSTPKMRRGASSELLMPPMQVTESGENLMAESQSMASVKDMDYTGSQFTYSDLRKSFIDGQPKNEVRAEIMRLYQEGDISRIAKGGRTSRETVLRLVSLRAWTFVLALILLLETVWFFWFISVYFSSSMLTLALCVDDQCQARNGCGMCIAADALGFITCVLLFFDVIVRWYAYTTRHFLYTFGNQVWVLIVIVSSFLIIFEMFQRPYRQSEEMNRTANVMRVVRLFKLVADYRAVFIESIRKMTGGTKKRFVSVEHGFNLDLVYITPQLIGMSVPAEGWTQLYRNPVGEVARFFEVYHPHQYLVVNVCPEKEYDPRAFSSGLVRLFDVKDHMPPALHQICDFLAVAALWKTESEENVLAVHCKGGKGRTGAFCCTWLLYFQKAKDAADALNYFAIKRTDLLARGPVKLQGVDTPSQKRYVEYIGRVLEKYETFYPVVVPLVLEVELSLLSLKVVDAILEDQDPGQCCVVVQDAFTRQALIFSEFGTCAEPFEFGGITVRGDIRVVVVARDAFRGGVELTTCYGGDETTPGNFAQKDDVYNHKKKKKVTSDKGTSLGWRAMKDREKKRRKKMKPGKEPGLLFSFTFHTTFHRAPEWKIPVSDVDISHDRRRRKMRKMALNKDGYLLLSFTEVEPDREEEIPVELNPGSFTKSAFV